MMMMMIMIMIMMIGNIISPIDVMVVDDNKRRG